MLSEKEAFCYSSIANFLLSECQVRQRGKQLLRCIFSKEGLDENVLL